MGVDSYWTGRGQAGNRTELGSSSECILVKTVKKPTDYLQRFNALPQEGTKAHTHDFCEQQT